MPMQDTPDLNAFTHWVIENEVGKPSNHREPQLRHFHLMSVSRGADQWVIHDPLIAVLHGIDEMQGDTGARFPSVIIHRVFNVPIRPFTN